MREDRIKIKEEIAEAFDLEEAKIWFFHQSLNGIVDDQGRFVALSNKWEETLGHSLTELLNIPFIDFVHPDDVEKTIAAYHQDTFEGTFRNRYLKADGSFVTLKWDNPGKTIGRFSTFKAEIDE